MRIRPFFLSTLLVLTTITLTAEAESKTDNEAPKKIMTTGLNHIGLTVKDLSKSSDFFIETLGWKRAGGYPDYPAIFVTDGQVFVTLWQTKDIESVIEFDRKNNVGLHHLALTVVNEETLTELHQRFKKTQGVIIEFPPELNGKGPTIHMIIREPSGNRLEFAFTPPKK